GSRDREDRPPPDPRHSPWPPPTGRGGYPEGAWPGAVRRRGRGRRSRDWPSRHRWRRRTAPGRHPAPGRNPTDPPGARRWGRRRHGWRDTHGGKWPAPQTAARRPEKPPPPARG